ncbi:hypothetical protein RJ640_028751 [Escallonia rubra]|uniref:Uncharacterized protein n=1 Tax=Escallonia rubra TaxID=112253 RepID=A0AA88UBD5_9ASTE|nr:hypothetical protein RJ640_028751 [Escallonia rubra]
MNYSAHGGSSGVSGLRSRASVCRVPLGMRRAAEDAGKHAYDPEVVSIGPFHHGNPALKLMEEHKNHVVSHSLEAINRSRSSEADVNQDTVITIDTLAHDIAELEQEARDCYSEAFDMHSERFRYMMVLDGLFIIDVFQRFKQSDAVITRSFPSNVDLSFWLNSHVESGNRETCTQAFCQCTNDGRERVTRWDQSEADLIFRSRWILPMLMLDFIKLENQLPLFILQKLFDLTHFGNQPYSFPYLALFFFSSFNPSMPRSYLSNHETRGILHLLELFHSVYKPTPNGPSRDERRSTGSIRDIQLADITFKKGESNLLDIKYNRTGKAILEIPQLLIDYSTGPLLRNWVALEQSTRSVKPYFTSYVIFVAELVNSPQDVEILRRGDVIVSLIGNDEEVASLLSNIRKEVILFERECYLSSLRHNIGDRMGNMWYQLLGRLKLVVFDPFGKYVAMIITIAAFYLAATQTTFTFLTFFRPRHGHS